MAKALRDFVRERVHKEGSGYNRGAATELAKAIGKPSSWVSHYVDMRPERNADLDTALAICAHYGVNLRDLAAVTGAVPVLDQGSGSHLGGPDGYPAPSERDRLSKAEAELKVLKAQYRQVQNAARAAFTQLRKVAPYLGQGKDARRAATGGSGAHRGVTR